MIDKIKMWFLQKGVEKMLTKLSTAVAGYKTYILALAGILIALSGHFWGPYTIGSIQVPQFGWGEVWQIVWGGGLFAALRNGIKS